MLKIPTPMYRDSLRRSAEWLTVNYCSSPVQLPEPQCAVAAPGDLFLAELTLPVSDLDL